MQVNRLSMAVAAALAFASFAYQQTVAAPGYQAPYFRRTQKDKNSGKGGWGGRAGNNAGKGYPHQGPHECAKRKRNCARGLQAYGTIKLMQQRSDEGRTS